VLASKENPDFSKNMYTYPLQLPIALYTKGIVVGPFTTPNQQGPKTMTTKEKTCDQRIESSLAMQLRCIEAMWQAEQEGNEDGAEGLGTIWDYGLHLDYQKPEGGPGYLCWLLMTGGPHAEFRFYLDADLDCYSIEYSYQDWFDGATRLVLRPDSENLHEFFDYLKECGTVEHLHNAAKE
jgi:hypothetical protein